MPKKKSVHSGKRVGIIRDIAEGLALTEGLTNYAEIGVRTGPVFNAVAPFAQNAYAVDIDESTYGHIRKNKNLKWYHGRSDDFFIEHSKVSFDMIFIDADHSHEASMKDFISASKVIRDNGLILMHDTHPQEPKYLSARKCDHVYETAWKIRQEYSKDFEIVTLPFYLGISIIRKANRQLLWK